MSKLSDKWFTEISPCSGTAFSLEINKHLETVQTNYQKIEIYDTTHFGKMMAIDGSIMLTAKENFIYHEMLVHTAMFTHPHPEEVIIIGGGDCGTLKEVLKHPSVKKVSQIEIDKEVTRLSAEYFPELCDHNNDPRAHFHFVDGIEWMKSVPPNSADVIIIDSTDPVGPAIGLFETEFHQACLNALRSNGVYIQQSESPLINQDILIAMRKSMMEAGFKHLLTVPFPQPVYQSGFWSVTLASKHIPLTELRVDPIPDDWQLKYYNHALHQAALTPQPFIKKIEQAIYN